MEIEDLAGRISVDREDELELRLRSIRKGGYGAAILSHDNVSLWIHFHNRVAYLHFFPDSMGRHPGFQPNGTGPDDCPEEVRFLLVDGFEGDAITMPRTTLVPDEVAYEAAKEFLRDPGPPASVSWSEL